MVMNKSTTLQSYKDRIKKAQGYIENHLDENVSLEELAAVANFSPYHFHRIFTCHVGETVKNYIKRLKMQRAARQIIATNKQILDIALDADFETAESFTRAFVELFKTSPSKFRREQRETRLATIKSFKLGDLKNMQVTIKDVAKMPVAAVRHVGPYSECGAAFQKLLACKALKFGPNTKLLGICYDDPEITEPTKIRYDACMTIDSNFQPVDGIEVKEVGGGKYAITRHIGPYTELYKTYRALCGMWIPQNGYEHRSEPPFEIYLNDANTTKPEDLITEIYIPIK